MLPRPRAQVHQVVGRADGLLVVLDDDHRVAEIAQPAERRQQAPVVALVEADGRLVEDVEHAAQRRANLRGQSDALPFAAGQGGRAAAERQVPDADVGQEPQAVLDLAQDAPADQIFAGRQRHGLEHLQRVVEREIHVLGDRAPLQPHAAALGLQAGAAARGAGAQRAEALERLLVEPGALVEAPPQVGQDPLEVAPERVGRLPGAPGARACGIGGAPVAPGLGPLEQQVAGPLGQLAEGGVEVDAVVTAERDERLAHQPRVAGRPRRNRPLRQRARPVGDDAGRVEVVQRPEPLALGARPVRRVEREGARRHLGHADAALDAGQPPREEPVARLEAVDDDDVPREAERHLHRVRQAALDPGLHQQAIDDHVDRVVAAAVEGDLLVERPHLSVDPRPAEAARAQGRQLLLELPLAPADDRRQDVDPLVAGELEDALHDLLERLRGDLPAALVAVRDADAGEEEPEVIVDLGDRADGRARVRGGGLLLDGDRRREAVDEIDVRLLHLLEELARVGRERLDVPPLPLGVDRVEGKGRLPRPRQAGDDHQLVPGQVHVDVLQVVDASAANGNPVVTHAQGWPRTGGLKPPIVPRRV